MKATQEGGRTKRTTISQATTTIKKLEPIHPVLIARKQIILNKNVGGD